jgi:hypothetical protein
MQELKSRPIDSPPPGSVPVIGYQRARTHLRQGLRDMARDLVGRPDRDELDPEHRLHLEAEVEAAVEQVVGSASAALERELAPRVQALPLAARATLASVRRRRDLGID